MLPRLLLAVAAALLLVGCAFPQYQSRYITPPVQPPTYRPTPPADTTTRPAALAQTTRPSATFDPQAYAAAIDEYLQRKSKATTHPAAGQPVAPSPQIIGNQTEPVIASTQTPTPTPPAHTTRPLPNRADDIRWIEPRTNPDTASDSSPDPANTITPQPPPAAITTRPVHVDDSGDTTSANRRIELPQPPRITAPQRTAISSDTLESQLARQVRDYPRDLAAQLDYQLLQLLRGRQVPQLDTIAGLSSDDREVLAAIVDALANFRTSARDDNAMLARKVRPLLELADRLRTQASLRVPVAKLCTRVDAFGIYDPTPSDRFVAGREHAVIVYCEVENFASRLNAQNFWQTDLTHEAVLYNDRGQRVLAEEKKRPVTDLSRNRRRDFFVVRLLKLPAGLAIGRYHLVVTITDQQAQRIAEASVPIQVVAEQ